MNNLELYRKELDKIDEEISQLFEKRMSIIKEIALFKIKNNLPVSDPSREVEMINRNCLKLSNKEFIEYYKEILTSFLKVSKDYQTKIREHKKGQ